MERLGEEVKYVNADLFTAPKGSTLIHSCNCYGSWGAGVAKAFYGNFPNAFNDYRRTCLLGTHKDLLGKVRLVEEGGFTVVSLFVSSGYGKYKDDPELILKHTAESFKYLNLLVRDRVLDIHMPKINSGLFNVEWSRTEELIKSILEPKHSVTVYGIR